MKQSQMTFFESDIPSASARPTAETDAGRTVSEYFAGIGLVRMGLESEGWRVVYANDFSGKKQEMYRAFFPEDSHPYVVQDIFAVDWEEIPRTALATCSFSCVDLSLAGKMEGIRGKHSSAFWGFADVLMKQGEHAPPLVLVENVPGWLSSNGGNDFRLTVQALNELGYSCDVFPLDARRFSPQSRLRIFLIGRRFCGADSRLCRDRILCRPRSLTSRRLKETVAANGDLKWFHAEMPEPPPLRTHGLSEILEPMEDDDARWWPEKEVRRHLDMMSEPHCGMIMSLIDAPCMTYRTFYRRRREDRQRAEVRSDDIAGCLRTAAGGSGRQFLIAVGQGKLRMRVLTAREYARLQGVPDHYPIVANGMQALTGFGDAVCVPAIAWIARNVLNPLHHEWSATRRAMGTHAVDDQFREDWFTMLPPPRAGASCRNARAI